jgi:hypothetical protein
MYSIYVIAALRNNLNRKTLHSDKILFLFMTQLILKALQYILKFESPNTTFIPVNWET